MQITTLALPVLIAFIVKCFFLYQSVMDKQAINKFLVAVIALMTLLNFLELIYFSNFGNHAYLLKIYYVIAIFALICIAKFTSNLTRIYIPFYSIIHIFGILLIPLIIFTDYLIPGVPASVNSIARAPGDYYFLFQIFVITQIISSILLITLSMFNEKKDILVRAKSSVMFVSLLPGLFIVFVVMFSMALYVRINLALLFLL